MAVFIQLQSKRMIIEYFETHISYLTHTEKKNDFTKNTEEND